MSTTTSTATFLNNQKIVLASSNAGKLAELQALLSPLGATLISQGDMSVDDAEETGLTFIENAILKARHASAKTGLPALADDSGLAVDALGGAPGIYSARYAAGDVGPSWGTMERSARDAANNYKLLTELRDVAEAERTAAFHCVLVFVRHAEDPVPVVCHGQWHGRILHEQAGEGGFGYDPLFYVPATDCSSAELPAGRKNQISHRALAMQLLLQQLTGTPPAALA
ncbi:RdgB/HAM1 family non-canonical purine NTP pyrophosphatase [Pseudohongiella sp. SYSU M77423]|uniref:RdgB/HAM1 family non-canonical purine NTP pyrophosphatase n=1 Tax=unclassified Pseudohongiella TaxID=2629611 RepID=UPI001F001C4D|nr:MULTISPECIES: RdgB/HAM1 family non-canonical purine NTP pyrophosphatase [unclassified Pseudohongiella]MDH7944105.1 RdgB/HAM1 family non-canonical purine NTP pyrophosphatase [Pseudohongiella sp. SYSU M77423]MEC8859310.1 RdgB/HAM1 family non-canonical purine NTP pyrophosphatase [Pseudomonadota bacterium]